MDFHSMKRPRLQSLCKKHGIPANLKNNEMADRLAAIYKDGEESNSQERSSLSTVDEVEEDDALVVKKLAKKVRFSPECETFSYEVSVRRRDARRKSMRGALAKNPDPVDKNVSKAEESKESINGPIRSTRSRVKKVEEKEEVATVVSPPAGKKRGRRNVVKSDSSESCGGIDKVNEGARDCPKRSRRSTRKPDEVEKAEIVSRSRRSQAHSKEVSEVQVKPLDVSEKEVVIIESDDSKIDEVDAEKNETIIQEDQKLMHDSRVNAVEQVQEVTIMSQADKQSVKGRPKRSRRNTRKADDVQKIEVVSRTSRSRARCKEASGVQEKEVLVVDSCASRNDGVDAEENGINIQEEPQLLELDDKQGVRGRPKRSRRNYRNADVEKVEIVSRSRRSRKQRKEEASGVQGEPSDVLEKEVLTVENSESKNDGVDAEENGINIPEGQNLMELHDSDGTAVKQVQEVTVMCQVDKHGEAGSSRMDTDMHFKRCEEISAAISSSGDEIVLQGSATKESTAAAIEKQETPAKSPLIAVVEKSSEVQLSKNQQSVEKMSGSAPKTQVEGPILTAESIVENPGNPAPLQVVNEEAKEGRVQSTLESMLDEDSQQAEDGKVIASLGVTVEFVCEMGGQLCQTLGSRVTNAAADLINSDPKESKREVNDMDSDEKTSTPDNFLITNQKDSSDKPPSPLNLDQGEEIEEPPSCENMSWTTRDVVDQCSKAPIEQDQILEFHVSGVISAEAEREVTINDDQNQLGESNGLKCMSPTPLKNVEEADSNALSVEEKLPQGESSNKAIDKEETWDESFLDAIESCFDNIAERHGNAGPALESQVEGTVTKGETGFNSTVCGGCSPEKKVESQLRSADFVHESVVKCCEDTDLVVDRKDGSVEDKSCQALNGSSPPDANFIQPEMVEFESSGQNLFSYVIALPANNSSPANEACQSYDLSQLFDLGNAMEMDEPSSGSNKDLKRDKVEADGQSSHVHEDTKLTNLEDANQTAAKVIPEVIVRNTFSGSSEHNISKGESEVALKNAEVSVPDCPAGEMIGHFESCVEFSPEAGKEKVATIQRSDMDHNATVGSPLRLESSSQDDITISQITVETENQGPEGSLKKLPVKTLNNLNDFSDMEGMNSVSVEERVASRTGRNTFSGSSEHNISKGESEVALKNAEVSVPACPAGEMIGHFESCVEFSPEAGKEKVATIQRSDMDRNATVGSPLRLESSSQDDITISQITVETENQGPEGSLKKLPVKTLNNLNDFSDMEGMNSVSVEERVASRTENASPADTSSPLSGTRNNLSFNDRLQDIKVMLDNFEAICRNNEDVRALPGDVPTGSLPHLAVEHMKSVVDDEAKGSENQAAMEDAIGISFEVSPLKESTVDNSKLVPEKFEHDQLVGEKSGCDGNVEQTLSEDYSATKESSKTEKGDESRHQVTDVPSNVVRTDISASGEGTGKIASTRETTEGLNDLFDAYTVEENNADQVPMEITDEYEKSLHEAMFTDVINSITDDHLLSLNEGKVDASGRKQMDTSELPDDKFDLTAKGSKDIGSCEEFTVDSLLENEMAIDPSFDSSADANLNEHKGWESQDESHYFTNWEMDLFCGDRESGEEMHPEYDTPETRLIGDSAEEFEENALKESVVQAVEEQFDGNKHNMVEEVTELKCKNIDVSIESNFKDGEDLKMEDDTATAIKMGSPQVSSDKTLLQKSSLEDGFDSSVLKEDGAPGIDGEEASEPIKDSSGLDMPAADQSQLFMDTDIGKEIASDENADAVENNLPSPEHINAEPENGSNTFFTKKMSPSVGERMSKTTFVPKMPKKLKMDSIHDMKENLLSPKWHQVASKTAPKPSSKRRALEDVPNHQF